MKWRRRGGLVLAFLAGIFTSIAVTRLVRELEPVAAHPYFAGTRPQNLAHRGGAGLGPEHQMQTYRASIQSGADLELDARLTADGQVVLVHDETLERTHGVATVVAQSSLAELRRSAQAARGEVGNIVTLVQVLREFPQARFNVELKTADTALADAVVDIITRANAESRVAVSSFRLDPIARVRGHGYHCREADLQRGTGAGHRP